MKRFTIGLVVLVALTLSMPGCASLFGGAASTTTSASTVTLTADQKARIVVGTVQDQLGKVFDAGLLYVKMYPAKQPEWKAKIVPAFDVANKSIATYMAAKDAKDPVDALSKATAMIQPVMDLLIVFGVNIGK